MCSNTSNKKLRHRNCRDWACLHGSLVYLLLDKLLEPIDHVRFAAVCKEWRAVSKDYNEAKQRWCKQWILPMLLISSAESEEKLELYSIAERKVYCNIELPLPCRKSSTRRCFGSNHDSGGWFTIVDVVEDDRYFIITLVNPFRKEVPPIQLPHLRPSQFNSIPLKGLKVTLSGDPTLNPDSFVVTAINERDNIVCSIKGLDGDWVCWDFAYSSTDAIVYENQVYSVTATGCLHLLDVDKAITSRFRPQTRDGPSADKAYLVESTEGDLLLVQRYMDPKKNANDGSHDQKLWTNSFAVHKVGFKKRDVKLDRGIPVFGSARWKQLSSGDGDRLTEIELFEVESIGDEALFVGNNYSFSVLASEYPGCQPNSIYYTDDDSMEIEVHEEAPYGMGIFNLEDKSITPLCSSLNLSKRNVQLPFWTIPQFSGLC